MLDLVWGSSRTCDGVGRRKFLRAGALGLSGLTLADWLRARASAGDRRSARADAVIQIYLGGGPSHLETYDPKPDAPVEYRGEFASVATNAPGLRLSEMLPEQAKRAGRLALVRGLHHSTSDHAEGAHWVMTGHAPKGSTPRANERPSVGSVVSRSTGDGVAGLPRYVALPSPPPFGNAAHLGPAFNPFSPEGDLASGTVRVPNLDFPRGETLARFEDRRGLLARLDNLDRRRDATGSMAGMDRFAAEAHAMITGPAARSAFDLAKEPERLRERYGRTTVGQACLLARRLVEAGVAFVTVHNGGWDHHGQVFENCRKQLPPLDQALGALLDDLQDRGMADRTLVVVWGEFGRTPRVNAQGGRDHWPGAFTAVLSGGGVPGGAVVGSTDRFGEAPVERPVRPQDVIATLYESLGIDPSRTFPTESARPIPILDDGGPIF